MTDTESGRSIDIRAMTVDELVAHIRLAEAVLKEKQAAAQTELVARWKAEAKAAGLTMDTLMAVLKGSTSKPRSTASEKLPAKYKGPNGEEWSGRGKLPAWLAKAEKHGHQRDEFVVKE